MLSPLKPLLCRHDFYWSERHRADRCRRCGKTQAAEAVEPVIGFKEPTRRTTRRPDEPSLLPGVGVGTLPEAFFDQRPADPELPTGASHARPQPSAKVLKSEALERREKLLTLLNRLADDAQPSRQDSLDAVLGVIEDAHSADPILFGTPAIDHFARLHQARREA